MKHAFIAAAALALAAGCSSSKQATTPERGSAVVRVDALAYEGNVTRIHLDVQPANYQVDFTSSDGLVANGTVTQVIQIVPGAQTFTATAFALDGEVETQVGEGSAVATIVGGQTVNVSIKVLDTSGPDPTPDMGPIVTSFVTPAAVDAGATVSLTSTAVDPDDSAPLSYAWTQSCSDGDGTFATPDERETLWTAPAAGGSCVVTLTATAGLLSDAASGWVEVLLGGADLTVDFVQQPLINSIWVEFQDGSVCEIYRDDENATCPGLHTPGAVAWVWFDYDLGSAGDYSVELTDSCGGVAIGYPEYTDEFETWFEWPEPGAAGACVLTAKVTNDGVTDEFPFAIVYSSCPEDEDEENDTFEAAGDTGEPFSGQLQSGPLFLNDHDYYAFAVAEGASSITLTIDPPTVAFEVLDETETLVAASSEGTLTAEVTPGARYVLHVIATERPPNTCGPSYQMFIDAPIPE